MSEYDFDLFTIGAGSGGVAASRRAASYGARVAISEESRVGGTCVIRGCVPKKLLVYGSHFADELADAAGFGWTIGESSFDWSRLIAAKNKEIDRLNGVYLRMLRDAGVKLFEGHTTVESANSVRVGSEVYTAKHILVATGGHPTVPKIPGAKLGITSNEALDLPALPKRVAVVGGGYIGVEFAGIFRSLGAEVTMLIRGESILRGFDRDVRAFLTSEMQKRGIKILPDVRLRDVEQVPGGLDVQHGDGDSLEVDTVLFATGRAPNSSGLGLEKLGVKINSAGAIEVDTASRTAVESIYAIGDVTDRMNLTPVAIAEGRAFAETMFHDNQMVASHENVPSAVFGQPPLACVGKTEDEARQSFGEIDVYVTNFKAMKHTLSGRDERTMMKLVVERKTQRVVGAHMVGADAPEIIQGIGIAVKMGATKQQFDATVGIHPTAAEEFVTMREKRA